MAMSKKDFIALADSLRTVKPDVHAPNQTPQQYTDAWAVWAMCVSQVADTCARSNPAFMRDRWMDYVNGECGPNGGKL
jgi:hypothetical protein